MPGVPAESAAGSISLSLPRMDGQDSPPVSLCPGETLFLLGANGSGKSSLIHRFFTTHQNIAHRIAANRDIWFPKTEVSPSGTMQLDEAIAKDYTTKAESRWNTERAEQILRLAISKLIHAENARARQIVKAENPQDKKQELGSSPFAIINKILCAAHMPIEVDLNDSSELIAQRKSGAVYSIAELSDGERAAVLIAAEVLLAKKGALLLIDEPERHLHRAISAPLLQALFARRTDCAFVISTHDIALVQAFDKAKILLLRDCVYQNGQPARWDADLIENSADIPAEIQTAILGARRKILFVEGEESSLDASFYQLLFPDYAVIAKSGCAAVIDAVKGARGAQNLHWLEVLGIIDNDGRTEAKRQELLQSGIYVLPVYAIESLYFCPEILAAMAEEKAENSKQKEEFRGKAQAALRQNVEQHIAATARDSLARQLRREIKAPTAKDLENPEGFCAERTEITADSLKQRLKDLEAELEAMPAEGDIPAILARFNLKCAGNAIAGSFGLRDSRAYAREVRSLLKNSESLRAAIISKHLNGLKGIMDNNQRNTARTSPGAATPLPRAPQQ